MENKKERAIEIFNLMLNLKIGDKLSIKFKDSINYNDRWYYFIINLDDNDEIELVGYKDKKINAGYSCVNIIDLLGRVLSAYGSGVIKDISLENMEEKSMKK